MYKYILILSKGDGDSSKRNLDQEKEPEDKNIKKCVTFMHLNEVLSTII